MHQTPALKHPLLEASRPGGLEGLAGRALSQKVKALVHQTLAPKHPLLEASRPGGLEGLAGQALSQKVKGS